jgi:flavin-dependent dehydrogenase
LATQLPAAAVDNYDVVVYGGTAGGVTAAIEAARLGKSVAIIEPSQDLGGMTTGGLSATDYGNKLAIRGLAREFYSRRVGHQSMGSQSAEHHGR